MNQSRSTVAQKCSIARSLHRVEIDAGEKANAVMDPELRQTLGLLAVSLERYRLRHEDRCPGCARQMRAAA